MRLFGTDGIRGIVSKTLTCELMYKLSHAIKKILLEKYDKPKILIGNDTRNSSKMLVYALASALASLGCDCDLVGVCTTPLISHFTMIKYYNIGIMISASHNLFEYNGVKIFNENGEKLTLSQEENIEKYIFSNNGEDLAVVSGLGEINDKLEYIEEYIEYLLSKSTTIKKYKIGLDLANGSTVTSAEKIFKKLSKELIIINDKPNGKNINQSCGATSLSGLQELVLKEKLDIAFAFDGDGDRLIAIDSKGNVIDGDYIIGVIALYLKKIGLLKYKKIAVTAQSNKGLIDYLHKEEIDAVYTDVGDKYVYEALKENDLSLGGEQSGHIIIKNILNSGCGELSAIIILNALEFLEIDIDQVLNLFSKYPQKTVNIKASEEEKNKLKESEYIQEKLKRYGEVFSKTGRILVRASGTENLIRVMVEDVDEENAQKTVSEIKNFIEKELKK